MQQTKMTYNKRLGIFVYEDDEYSQQELKAKKAQTAGLMRYLDRKANEAEAKLRARGVCPKCHCILPTSGICDCQ